MPRSGHAPPAAGPGPTRSARGRRGISWGESIAGRSRGFSQPGQELLRELEALAVALGLVRDPQLEWSFEPVVAVWMLHQSYDRARVHLVRLLEQRITTLRAQVEA